MSRVVKFGCRSLVVAKAPAVNHYRPEPAYRRIESSYQSNMWVATLPLTPEELESLTIQEEARMITLSSISRERRWTHQLSLPSDAKSETVNARTNRGTLYITAQLEEPYLLGKSVPILKC